VPESHLELAPEAPPSLSEQVAAWEFGSLSLLRRALTHTRISGHLSDTLYSMEATNTEFLAYQFKPVLRLLESSSRRLLIADEVGLGKTIEAGLIWTELRARFDARRLLVICPPALQDKWSREFRDRFGVDARVCHKVDDLLKALKDRANSEWALIVRMSALSRLRRRKSERSEQGKDWEDPENQLPPARLARFLKERAFTEGLVDLLVVDEVHHCRNAATQIHDVVRLATDVATHAVFLSATPIHNRQDDLFTLLTLLEPHLFTHREVLTAIQEWNAPILQARDALQPGVTAAKLLDILQRNDIPEGMGINRIVRDLENYVRDEPLTQERRTNFFERLDRVNAFSGWINRTRRRHVQEERVKREPVSQPVRMHPREREYYDFVGQVVEEYAEKLPVGKEFLRVQPQRLMASSFRASLDQWFQDEAEWTFHEDIASESALQEPDVEEERPLISLIRDRIKKRWPDVSTLKEDLGFEDTKARLLVDKLQEFFERYPKEKVVLFSTFRATVDYMGRRLATAGIPHSVLKGGADVDEELKRFADPEGPSVLLSTEVGGEGVDLQFARLLINYDLPWNPMRVEQRIGRLDRIGQTAERITIWTLLHEDTIDFRIHERLYEKLDLFQQAFGDYEPIVGKELRELEKSLLTGRLGPEEQETRIAQTADTLAKKKRDEERLEEQAAGLLAHGEHIQRRIQDSRDQNRWLSAKDIRNYVVDFIKETYPGSDFRESSTGSASRSLQVEVTLSEDAKRELEDFVRSMPRSATTVLTQPGNSKLRCEFNNRLGTHADGQIETISQFHPLTRFVGKRLNQMQSEGRLYPAVAARVATSHLDAFVVPGRYLLVAKIQEFEGARRETRIAYGAAPLDGSDALSAADAERLATNVVRHGEDWSGWRAITDRERVADLCDRLFPELTQGLSQQSERIRMENEDRVNRNVSAIDRRREGEKKRFDDLIEKHRQHGREGLARAEEKQKRSVLDRLDRQKARLQDQAELTIGPQAEVFVALVLVESAP